MDLTLVHQRQLVRMQELDRILDGHDVLTRLAVQLIDHRSQGGGLARASGARDQNESALEVRDIGNYGWQSQFVEAKHAKGDGSEGAGDGAALRVDVRAKAGQVLHAEGEVELVLLFERHLLLFGEHRVTELLRVDRG